MRVRLVFLGRLQDTADTGERELDVAADATVAEVVAALEPDLAAALTSPRVRIAVNGELAQAGLRLCEGAEVAFLPPVSGG